MGRRQAPLTIITPLGEAPPPHPVGPKGSVVSGDVIRIPYRVKAATAESRKRTATSTPKRPASKKHVSRKDDDSFCVGGFALDLNEKVPMIQDDEEEIPAAERKTSVMNGSSDAAAIAFVLERAQQVPSVLGLTGLEVVLLRGNDITDISGLYPCGRLKYVDVSYNKISAVPGRSFFEGGPGPAELMTLLLDHNFIPGDDWETKTSKSLAAAQCLTVLTLEANPIATMRKYRSALVNCVPNLQLLDRYPVADEELIQDANFSGTRYAAPGRGNTHWSNTEPPLTLDFASIGRVAARLGGESSLVQHANLVTKLAAQLSSLLSPALLVQRVARRRLRKHRKARIRRVRLKIIAAAMDIVRKKRDQRKHLQRRGLITFQALSRGSRVRTRAERDLHQVLVAHGEDPRLVEYADVSSGLTTRDAANLLAQFNAGYDNVYITFGDANNNNNNKEDSEEDDDDEKRSSCVVTLERSSGQQHSQKVTQSLQKYATSSTRIATWYRRSARKLRWLEVALKMAGIGGVSGAGVLVAVEHTEALLKSLRAVTKDVWLDKFAASSVTKDKRSVDVARLAPSGKNVIIGTIPAYSKSGGGAVHFVSKVVKKNEKKRTTLLDQVTRPRTTLQRRGCNLNFSWSRQHHETTNAKELTRSQRQQWDVVRAPSAGALLRAVRWTRARAPQGQLPMILWASHHGPATVIQSFVRGACARAVLRDAFFQAARRSRGAIAIVRWWRNYGFNSLKRRFGQLTALKSLFTRWSPGQRTLFLEPELYYLITKKWSHLSAHSYRPWAPIELRFGIDDRSDTAVTMSSFRSSEDDDGRNSASCWTAPFLPPPRSDEQHHCCSAADVQDLLIRGAQLRLALVDVNVDAGRFQNKALQTTAKAHVVVSQQPGAGLLGAGAAAASLEAATKDEGLITLRAQRLIALEFQSENEAKRRLGAVFMRTWDQLRETSVPLLVDTLSDSFPSVWCLEDRNLDARDFVDIELMCQELYPFDPPLPIPLVPSADVPTVVPLRPRSAKFSPASYGKIAGDLEKLLRTKLKHVADAEARTASRRCAAEARHRRSPPQWRTLTEYKPRPPPGTASTRPATPHRKLFRDDDDFNPEEFRSSLISIPTAATARSPHRDDDSYPMDLSSFASHRQFPEVYHHLDDDLMHHHETFDDDDDDDWQKKTSPTKKTKKEDVICEPEEVDDCSETQCPTMYYTATRRAYELASYWSAQKREGQARREERDYAAAQDRRHGAEQAREDAKRGREDVAEHRATKVAEARAKAKERRRCVARGQRAVRHTALKRKAEARERVTEARMVTMRTKGEQVIVHQLHQHIALTARTHLRRSIAQRKAHVTEELKGRSQAIREDRLAAADRRTAALAETQAARRQENAVVRGELKDARRWILSEAFLNRRATVRQRRKREKFLMDQRRLASGSSSDGPHAGFSFPHSIERLLFGDDVKPSSSSPPLGSVLDAMPALRQPSSDHHHDNWTSPNNDDDTVSPGGSGHTTPRGGGDAASMHVVCRPPAEST